MERARLFSDRGSPLRSSPVDVTPYPVRLGTTYLDAGPVLKPGSVTEFDRPIHLSFHHTVQIRQSPMNTDVDARIRYKFVPKEDVTFVDLSLVLTFNFLRISRQTWTNFHYDFRNDT